MMHAYGRDINEVLQWTYPQLRLIGKYQAERLKEERRWQLVLSGGMLSQEAFDSLWEALDGTPVQHVSSGSGSSSVPRSTGRVGQRPSLAVDAHGNVLAPAGTPRLDEMSVEQARGLPFPVVTRWVDNDGNPVDPPEQYRKKKPDGS